jgi:hypothetical protein
MRCGIPQRRGEGPHGAVAPAAAVGSRNETWVVCEVVWWRGHSRSDFYARAIAPDRDVEVARSPEFWWPHANPPPPEHAQAHAAHAALVRKLISTGWEPLGGSSPWYAQRFRRRDSVPEAPDRDRAG